MRSLIAVSSHYALIYVVAVIVAFAPDMVAIAREWTAPQGEKRDRGSFLVFTTAISLGWLLAYVCAFALPGAAIGASAGAQVVLFWVGVALMLGGMAFRYYAVFALGRYFTREVTVHAGQSVVERGPYRYIRHPSYTGLLLAMVGVGLALGNWAGLVAVVACSALGSAYRIAVEERELRRALGEKYVAYMQRTRRLIPFIL